MQLHLLPLLSTVSVLSYALPQIPQTLPAPSIDPSMTFQVSDFYAYTTSPDIADENWAAFLVFDADRTYGAVCSLRVFGQLYSADWTPCEMRQNVTAMAIAFQIGDGFNEVRVKKVWDSHG
jgi:hypothetical protein